MLTIVASFSCQCQMLRPVQLACVCQADRQADAWRERVDKEPAVVNEEMLGC
jgi:hypothetical protein